MHHTGKPARGPAADRGVRPTLENERSERRSGTRFRVRTSGLRELRLNFQVPPSPALIALPKHATAPKTPAIPVLKCPPTLYQPGCGNGLVQFWEPWLRKFDIAPSADARRPPTNLPTLATA
jgi:hypothetical protein